MSKDRLRRLAPKVTAIANQTGWGLLQPPTEFQGKAGSIGQVEPAR